MWLASGDKSAEGQLYGTFKLLALQWIKAGKSPGHIDGEMKIALRSDIESAHVYCQMLQCGLERSRPFGQGVYHGGTCIFERDAVELSELTNNLSLFLSEASLDAKSVEAWLQERQERRQCAANRTSEGCKIFCHLQSRDTVTKKAWVRQCHPFHPSVGDHAYI